MQVSEKTVEISQLQAVEKTDEIRTDVGTQTSESSGIALVEDTEASASKTPDLIEAHDQASFKTTRNPSGESYSAFASEKSWNEASGKTIAHRHVPSIETVFLLFPLSASSLRCVCVARYLSCGSSCPAGERTHTLGAECCHIMSLFGL